MLGGDADREHDTALVIGAKDVLVATRGKARDGRARHPPRETPT